LNPPQVNAAIVDPGFIVSVRKKLDLGQREAAEGYCQLAAGHCQLVDRSDRALVSLSKNAA
jgi:hypothetical protein